MTFIPSLLGKIDANNSTTTNLSNTDANNTFTGTATNVSGYESVIINVYADQPSSDNGLQVQFSTNNTDWETFITFTVPQNSFITKSYPVIANYYRVIYTNGAEVQTVFRLQSSIKLTGSTQIENCSIVSLCNSNLGTINANTTWYGTWEDISQSAQIITNFISSQNGTFSLQFSSVGNTAEIDKVSGPYNLVANIDCNQMFAPVRKYFRIVFGNTSGSSANVSIETRLLSSTSILYNNLVDTLDKNTSCMSNRSVSFGLNENDTNYTQIRSNSEGNLKVAIGDPLSVFGELSTIEPHPVCQIDYVYNQINPYIITTSVAESGSVSVANQLLSLTTGTTNNGSASMSSVRQILYKAGQGAMARFSAIFNMGVADTSQLAGIGTTENGYFFCYYGTQFGIIYRTHSSGSVAETLITQNQWNVDVMDGSNSMNNKSGVLLDPTKGNVYQIKYQYLGFGVIKFYVETISGFTLVHVINYPNAYIATNVSNPSLPLHFSVLTSTNLTNVQNITLKTASGALFIEGKPMLLGSKFGTDHIVTGVTSLINIMSIKCNPTFNSITNMGQIRLRNVSVACANNSQPGLVTLQIIKNPTLTNSIPAYSNYETYSMASINTTHSTTITGGTTLLNTSIASNGNQFVDVTDMDLFLNADEIFSFAVKATVSTNVSVSFCWSEII